MTGKTCFGIIFLGHQYQIDEKRKTWREAMINMVNQSLFSYKPNVNYASFSKVIVLNIKISTDYRIV